MAVRLVLNGRVHRFSNRHSDAGEEVTRLVAEGRMHPVEAMSYLTQVDGRPEADTAGEEQARRVQDVLADLDRLVGLNRVKALVREIQAYVEIQQRRRSVDLAADPLALHMIFKGNPGTGKTTVARIIARVFKEMGVLSKGHLVEVERADLVGEYIGHTAQKTRQQIQKAIGGVLFIDEAYSLARGGEKDFGKEAIDTLVRAMEEHRDNLVMVLAGYRNEMEWFLLQNPGLRSRFAIHMEFPDYTGAELMQIAENMLEQRQYRLTDGARARLAMHLNAEAETRSPDSGNGRSVRNLIERAIRRQAVRLVTSGRPTTRDDLMRIRSADVEAALAG